MKATVRRFHSPDADFDTYSPNDPEDVGLLVQIMAGPEGKPGDESFYVVVCTPRWLERRVREDGPLIGHYLVVIESWDTARVQLFLTSAVESMEASNWHELAGKIGRIGKWEFQDYVPYVEDRGPD